MVSNFKKLDSNAITSLFESEYIFVNIKDVNVTGFFEKKDVKVKIGQTMKKEGKEYSLMFCKVPKKQEHNFERAMKEFYAAAWRENNLYPDFCEEFNLLIDNYH